MSDVKSSRDALEPKVAKIEGIIESLTKDVRDLVVVVRSQHDNMGEALRSIEVAVTKAAAPRRVEWAPLIGTGVGVVGLLMAIGAAVLSPLQMRVMSVEDRADRSYEAFRNHESLPLHPVGQQRVVSIEASLRDLEQRVKENVAMAETGAKERVEALRTEFDDVRKNGTSAVRERLAVLEAEILRLKTITKEAP